MASEREVKFRVVDRAALVARLLELEAEHVTPTRFEDNWVFDRGEELRQSQCLLRLRTDKRGSTLTYKGPPTFEGPVKVRLEFESGVDEPEAIRRLLEQLGFAVTTRYQKRRDEWRIGGISVALDNTPMGDYVEFEGEGAEKLAARCGFATGDAERRTYLELYAEHRRANPGVPEEMVFD
jgi:adenylate cyclase class 2